MPQHRDLLPLTVYLPSDAKATAERRAAALGISTAALLRQILLGLSAPLEPPAEG